MANRKTTLSYFVPLLFLTAFTLPAQTNHLTAANAVASPPFLPPASVSTQASPPLSVVQRGEQIRAECVRGRRLICGKILKVLPDGLVVDSGYTDLLRPPLNKSWLIPGSVVASRAANVIEGREPESVCVGLVFLEDIPKARGAAGKPKQYDYVVLMGYPAGQHSYTSAGTVQKTVRCFSANILNAVKLNYEKESSAPYGLSFRPAAQGFLRMPAHADGALPRLLSQTGAFADAARLAPASALIPYDIRVPFWSDGAEKSRWVSVPRDQTIGFAPAGEWVFPRGTVFVKTFTLTTNESKPEGLRRLETRLLVCDADGGVYGVAYKWRADNSDADLLSTNLAETIMIQTATGIRTQQWYYPSRQDCLACHTANAGYVLGVKTRQLNRDLTYASGVTDNELRAWNHLGLFGTNLDEAGLETLPRLARADDPARSLENRARSYLDANCSQCHRPHGTVAGFDARYDTPLAGQNLINGRVLIDERIDGARIIAPNDPWRSILFMRANTTEPFKMPPLARNTIDGPGMALLRQWIESLPGPPVLPPPEMSPRGGTFEKPLDVALKSEPGATIRYTLDGTVPASSDLLYEKPIQLTGPTILRAKAFKPGCTKSITSQEIYLVGE